MGIPTRQKNNREPHIVSVGPILRTTRRPVSPSVRTPVFQAGQVQFDSDTGYSSWFHGDFNHDLTLETLDSESGSWRNRQRTRLLSVEVSVRVRATPLDWFFDISPRRAVRSSPPCHGGGRGFDSRRGGWKRSVTDREPRRYRGVLKVKAARKTTRQTVGLEVLVAAFPALNRVVRVRAPPGLLLESRP